MKTASIDPDKNYSARELIAFNILGKDLPTITRRLLADKTSSKPVFDAEIYGDGIKRRYFVKGSRILSFLKGKKK